MGYTADTKFKLFETPDNAALLVNENQIEVGKDTITLETLVHEISEMETMVVLKTLGQKPRAKFTLRKRGYTNNVAHFVSPYGEDSFLNPLIDLHGRPQHEEFLEE
jgi:hypothetical protein